MLEFYRSDRSARYPFSQPELSYDYNALDPYIDERTMEIHYTKHHASYISNLNAVLDPYTELHTKTLSDLLRVNDMLPEKIQQAVINHGGGHANHMLFWKIMQPEGSNKPGRKLTAAINQTYSSLQNFKSEFSKIAAAHFGSGWAWLAVDEFGENLHITSTPNQDSPLLLGHVPLLGLDLWEHAYYLSYQNRRADYIEAWWNVLNWDVVSDMYEEVTSL